MGFLDKVSQKLKQASQGGNSQQNRPQQGGSYRPQQQQQYYQQQQHQYPQAYAQNQTVAPGTFAAPVGPPPTASYAPPPGAPPQTAPRSGEDPFSSLSKYDTVFIADDSESMEMHERELRDALAAAVEKVVQYDSDGIDVYFFNNKSQNRGLRSTADVMRLLRSVPPRGSTPTATALKRVLEPYLSDLENWLVEGKPINAPKPKPMNLIILTDGAPNRGEDPEPVIVDAAQRLDKGRWPPYQLGIQFVQIGQDEEATEHLKNLDDNLKTKHRVGRDMVDTTLFTGGSMDQYILQTLLGGINRTIDRQN